MTLKEAVWRLVRPPNRETLDALFVGCSIEHIVKGVVVRLSETGIPPGESAAAFVLDTWVRRLNRWNAISTGGTK